MENQDKNGGPNFVRAWREYRELTQSQLANAIGTNANMVGYLEAGERGLSAKWLRKIAEALNTTPGMLMDHDPRQLDADVIDMWSRADLKSKQQITQIAKMLVGGRNND